MRSDTITAALAPAEQLAFRPRVSADFGAATGSRRPLVVVPPLEECAAVDELASVHRLPVTHTGDVYRRRRLVALALVIGLLLGVVSFVSSADATPTLEGQRAESVTVVVQPGDTLWGIAVELDPDGDPRMLVDRLGGLADSSSLQPGQRLVIPGHWLG